MVIERCNGIQLFPIAVCQRNQFFNRVYAMFLLQGIDEIQPFIDIVKPGRIEFHFLLCIGNFEGDILQFNVAAVQPFCPFLCRRVHLRNVLQRLHTFLDERKTSAFIVVDGLLCFVKP